MQKLFLLIALLTISMVCFVGCSKDDLGIKDILIEDEEILPDGSVIEDMYIEDVGISISEDSPAQIMVTVYGSHSNGCVSVHEVHHEQQGDSIYIQATKRVGGLGIVCTTAETEVKKQISIGEFSMFPAGEYKIIANDIEQVFRVEDGEIWITRNPLIKNFEISISKSRPAQVTVNFKGYFWEACIPFVKTHQKQEGNTIYIQIIGEIPSGIDCPLLTDRSYLRAGLSHSIQDAILNEYQNEVSIGEFAAGKYIVKVNDITREFVIE